MYKYFHEKPFIFLNVMVYPEHPEGSDLQTLLQKSYRPVFCILYNSYKTKIKVWYLDKNLPKMTIVFQFSLLRQSNKVQLPLCIPKTPFKNKFICIMKYISIY